MKKRNKIFTLLSFAVLYSCTNTKKDIPKEQPNLNTKTVSSTQTLSSVTPSRDSSKGKKHVDVLLGTNYSFSTDSLCQTLTIKEISANKKFKIPEELKFTLTLHDKQFKHDDKIFEGIAQLASSEESFSDPSDKDGGDYSAADYTLKAKNYEIMIRLDIQYYEACVVLITTNQAETVLGGFNTYLRKFPNDGVMKQGECE